MANIVQIKRSSVAGRQPNVADLQVGELAVNLMDGILYTKDGNGNLIIIGSQTTSNVVESGNLYFSNVRAIDAVQPAKTELEVTNSGSTAYLFDQYSGNNPTIYVNAGDTIAFSLGNFTSHPFAIRDSSGGSNYNTGLSHVARDGTLTTGSSAQGKTSGVLYFKVPYSLAGTTKVYQCTVHSGMVGTIQIGKPTSTLDTGDIPESGNLYYTDARVYANVDSIGYASNTYVNTRVDTKANVTDLTTSNVTELTNLYFTNTRAVSALTGGNQIAIDANGLITSTASGGGGGGGGNVDSVVGATGDVSNVQVLAGIISAGIDTDDVAEGSANLYFTNTRSISALTAGEDIALDANGLITVSASGAVTSVGGLTGNVNLVTANIGELTNLYFTNTRAVSALTGGANISIDANGLITCQVQAGGGSGGAVSANGQLTALATFEYVASQGQTVFTGSDANGSTLENNTGSIDVFLNGIRLISSVDYTSNASHVTLIDSADINDRLSVLVYSGSSTSYSTQSFTGDGSTTDYSLSISPANKSSFIVTLDGVKQHTSEFSLSGNTLTFNSAPYDQANIEIQLLGLPNWNNTSTVYALTGGNDINIDANGLITSSSVGGVSSIGGLTGNVNLVTANVAEQDNLYYTDTRAFANLSSATTTSLTEGDNLYFTNTRSIYSLTAGSGIEVAANGRITASASGGSVNLSQYPPAGPSEGDFWIDNQSGDPYIYFDDGSSQQWVDLFGSKFNNLGSNVLVATRLSGSVNLPVDASRKVNVITRSGTYFAQVPLIN